MRACWLLINSGGMSVCLVFAEQPCVHAGCVLQYATMQDALALCKGLMCFGIVLEICKRSYMSYKCMPMLYKGLYPNCSERGSLKQQLPILTCVFLMRGKWGSLCLTELRGCISMGNRLQPLCLSLFCYTGYTTNRSRHICTVRILVTPISASYPGILRIPRKP